MSVLQRWSQLLQTCKAATRDSATLMREVIRAPAEWRTALVTQARRQPDHNIVAGQLLLMEKAVNDMRYYGISQYIKTRLPALPLLATSTTTTPTATTSSPGVQVDEGSSSSAASTSTPPSSPTSLDAANSVPKVAKIAFMITSAMKQELAILGYSTDDVKRMTPLHASLVLENSVPPHQYEEKMPNLVEEYNQAIEIQREIIKRQEEEELLRQQQQELEFLRQQQVEHELQQLQEEAKTDTATALESDAKAGDTASVQAKSEHSSSPEPTEDSSQKARQTHGIAGFASHNLLHQPTAQSGREWFEIVETTAEGDETVTALYSTEKEAQEGLEVRQKVAARRVKDRSATSMQKQQAPQFEIRRVIKY